MKKLLGLHPFLIALMPVTLLLTGNMDVVGFTTILVPAMGSLLLAGLVLVLVWCLRRDYVRSAIITSVILLAFFYYGRVFYLLWGRYWFQEMAHLHVLLGLLSLGAVVISGLIIWRTRRSLDGVAIFLTVAPIAIFIMSGVRIVRRQMKGERSTLVAAVQVNRVSWPPPVLEDSDRLPDVYDIVLDGYARQDTLKAIYGMDNTPFLDALRQRGFYVADQAVSNYPATLLSIPSTLNMRYMNEEARSLTERQISGLVQESEVVRTFKNKGYRYVHFASPWLGANESKLADITYRIQPWLFRDEFTSTLLRFSALCLFEPSLAHAHLVAFEKLGEVPAIRGPTFTFAHMLISHNPYVFDRDGNILRNVPMGLTSMLKGEMPLAENDPYIEQLLFANQKTLEVIDRILERSPVRPIIILHSDHGSPWLYDRSVPDNVRCRARMGILCALYVPEKCRRELYPTMSSVNLYRLVLRGHFGDNLENLPDRSYYHLCDKKGALAELTDQVQGVFPPAFRLGTILAPEPRSTEYSPRSRDK